MDTIPSRLRLLHSEGKRARDDVVPREEHTDLRSVFSSMRYLFGDFWEVQEKWETFKQAMNSFLLIPVQLGTEEMIKTTYEIFLKLCDRASSEHVDWFIRSDVNKVYKFTRMNDSECLRVVVRSTRVRPDVLQALLRHEDVECRAIPMALGSECLSIAVQRKRVSYVKLLIQDRRLDVCARPRETEPDVLRELCKKSAKSAENLAILKLLIADERPGVFAEPRFLESDCLRRAVVSKNEETVRVLVGDTRPGVYCLPSAKSSEALHIAVENGSEEIVKILLDDNRDGRARPDDELNGQSMLDRAAWLDHESIVLMLLKDRREYCAVKIPPYAPATLYHCVRYIGNNTTVRTIKFVTYWVHKYGGSVLLTEAMFEEDAEFVLLKTVGFNLDFVKESFTEFMLLTGCKLPILCHVEYLEETRPFSTRPLKEAPDFPFVVFDIDSTVPVRTSVFEILPRPDELHRIEDAREPKDAQGRYIFYRDLTEVTSNVQSKSRRPVNIPHKKLLRLKSEAFIEKAFKSREPYRLKEGTLLYHGGSDRLLRNNKCCYFLSHDPVRAYTRNAEGGEFHAYVVRGVDEELPTLHEWTWTMSAVVWDQIDVKDDVDWARSEDQFHNNLAKFSWFHGRWSRDGKKEVMLTPQFYGILKEDYSLGNRRRNKMSAYARDSGYFDDAEDTEEYDRRRAEEEGTLEDLGEVQ